LAQTSPERSGLNHIRLHEEAFVLGFDEWFDRGTANDSKEKVNDLYLANRDAASMLRYKRTEEYSLPAFAPLCGV
jgi:hypothetical protein